MSSVAVEVDFDLQPPDVLAWWRFQWGRQKSAKLFPWLSGLVLALLAMARANRYQSSLEATLATGFLVMIVGFFVSRQLLMASLSASAASLQKSKGGSATFGTHHLRVDADGISEQGPSGTHSHRWEAVDEFYEAPLHFFLIVAGGFAYVIPKRAFLTAGAAAGFWSGAQALKAGH